LLARHFTEAGPIETAALLWGKAGQRSLARSALIEGVSQLGKALGQIATLPGSATAPPSADQASGRACERSNACQRLRGT
jgi:hypothetical protein